MSLAVSLPLHKATIQGKCDDILKLIDSNQAEVDQQDHEGTTALILACASNQLPVASLLLQKGANPNVQRHTGSGPLFFACQGGFLDLVELLLRYNAPVAHSSCEGGCPFLVACQNGHLKTVERLLHHSNDTSLLNAKLRDGANGLFLAAQNGHLATVEFLLRRGIGVDVCRKDGTSALYIATQMAHVDICSALLKAGANANISREDGSTPLHRAAQKGFTDVVKVLLEFGKPSLGLLANGTSALHVAASNGDATLCQLLIQEGADPTKINQKGDSALSIAQASKNSALVSIFQSFQPRAEISQTQNVAQPQSNSTIVVPTLSPPQSQSIRPIEVSSTPRSLPYARPPGLRYSTKPYDVSGCRHPIPAQQPVCVNMNSHDPRPEQSLLNHFLTRDHHYAHPYDNRRILSSTQQPSKQHYMYGQPNSHLQQRPQYSHNQQPVQQTQYPTHQARIHVTPQSTESVVSQNALSQPSSQQTMYPPQPQPQLAYQQQYHGHVGGGTNSTTALPSAYRSQNMHGFYNGHYR